MSSLDSKILKNKNTEQILKLKNILIYLRIKKGIKQNFKSHIVKQQKKKLSKALTLEKLF